MNIGKAKIITEVQIVWNWTCVSFKDAHVLVKLSPQTHVALGVGMIVESDTLLTFFFFYRFNVRVLPLSGADIMQIPMFRNCLHESFIA